jgi:hypothetical protein
MNRLQGLTKASVLAGAFLLGLAAPGAQAAVIQVFSQNLAGWQAAAGAPVLTEDFNDAALIPELSITFGSDLPGSISGGLYNDRANDSLAEQATKPLFTFNDPLGVSAFGADWNLGPNDPGTGIRLFITFVDTSTDSTVLILNPDPLNTGFVGFFGIVSDTAIRSIRFDEGTQQVNLFETFNMDNAQLVSAVPIPAALPLFLSAIAALGFLGRRRMRLAAA